MKLIVHLGNRKASSLLLLSSVTFIRTVKYLSAESNEFNVVWSSFGAICAIYHLGLASYGQPLAHVLRQHGICVFGYMRGIGDPLHSWKKADRDYINSAKKIHTSYSSMWRTSLSLCSVCWSENIWIIYGRRKI